MSYFADMGTLTMGCAGACVRAVGWLDPDHPFTSGPTPAGFVDCLQRFVQASARAEVSRHFGLFMGAHACEFCDDSKAPGFSNIGVPSGEVIFIAPELIVHYVSRHSYCPPTAFVTAVVTSPLPGTVEYSIAVRSFLGRLEPSDEDARQIGESVGRWVHRVRQARRDT